MSKELYKLQQTKREMIAEGFSGQIFKTKIELKNGNIEDVVIKKFKNERHFITEKEIFQEINPHQLFPKIYFSNFGKQEICMEYCKGGTLMDVLLKCVRFEEDVAFIYFKQILEALRHLKRHNICHRDVKLENILVIREDDKRFIKMIDLSFCMKTPGAETKEQGRYFQDSAGTGGYQAPEILKGMKFSGYEVDMFSLGVVLFEMIHGKRPFLIASKEKCDFYNLFCNETSLFWKLFEKFAPNKSHELIKLIEQLLEDNSNKRISLEKVFESKWLNKMEQKMKQYSNANFNERKLQSDFYKRFNQIGYFSYCMTSYRGMFKNSILYFNYQKLKSQNNNINQFSPKKTKKMINEIQNINLINHSMLNNQNSDNTGSTIDSENQQDSAEILQKSDSF